MRNVLGLSLDELKEVPERELAYLKNSAREKMLKMKPDYVIDSVADLLPIIDQINRRLDLGEKPNSYSRE